MSQVWGGFSGVSGLFWSLRVGLTRIRRACGRSRKKNRRGRTGPPPGGPATFQIALVHVTAVGTRCERGDDLLRAGPFFVGGRGPAGEDPAARRGVGDAGHFERPEHRHALQVLLCRDTVTDPDLTVRERVLDRARAVQPPRPSRLDRLWFSRPLRAAAASLAVVFVLVVFMENRRVEQRLAEIFVEPPAAQAEDIGRVSRELGIDVGLRERVLDASRRNP